MGEIKTKKCSKCRVEKCVGEFHKQAKGRLGRSAQCKLCTKEYCERNKGIIDIRSREWYENNKARKSEVAKIWYQENKDSWKETSKLWYENNKGRKAETSKLWRDNNLSKANASCAKYRASKLERTPAWLTEDEMWLISEIYEHCSFKSDMLGVQHHVDHIIPLQGELVSGLHVPNNLQILTEYDNLSKSNKYTVD